MISVSLMVAAGSYNDGSGLCQGNALAGGSFEAGF
jgi:hypothetical protein